MELRRRIGLGCILEAGRLQQDLARTHCMELFQSKDGVSQVVQHTEEHDDIEGSVGARSEVIDVGQVALHL